MAGFRDDPEWQAARAEYTAELDGEDDSQALVRRVRAAFRLYEIESGQAASIAPTGVEQFGSSASS